MSQPIRGQGGHLVFPIGPKNTNLVEDVEILLPVKFCWIPFSGFRGEVENVSANQRPGRPSCFSDRPEKHKLGRGRWDLPSCKVSSNSVQWFQRRSRKCEKLTTTDGQTTDDGQRMITIVHLSLRLRCTKKYGNGFYTMLVCYRRENRKIRVPDLQNLIQFADRYSVDCLFIARAPVRSVPQFRSFKHVELMGI